MSRGLPRRGRLRGGVPLLSVWVVLAAAGLAQAETVPERGAVDPRIRTARCRAEEVYRLQAFVGYEIELIFEAGEVISGQGGGDLAGLALDAHDNHVILKPRAVTHGSNLVIYTNRRAYRFDYSVIARRPDPLADEVMYAVRFLYPPSSSTGNGGPSAAEQVEIDLARARDHRPRNFDYWFGGSPAVKPVAASDDGVHTRLTFGARAELPALFVRNDDGSESLLNFSMDRGDVIIHRVAPKFIVRRGKLTGCIVNRGFIGSGERLESGTVAPEVVRERKGSSP